MSVEASSWAWEVIRCAKLPQGQALVLLRLANHANSDDVCFPGIQQGKGTRPGVAEYIAMSPRRTQDAMKALEAAGLISRMAQQQSRGRGRGRDLIKLHRATVDPESLSPDASSGETEPAGVATPEPAPSLKDGETDRSQHDQPDAASGETGPDQPDVRGTTNRTFCHDQPDVRDIRSSLKGTVKEPSRESCPPSPSAPADDRLASDESDGYPAFVHRLCDLHCRLVNERTNRKKPYVVLEDWLVEMDRLIRIDGRSVEEVERAIQWVHRDDFWRANILSVPKLREQFDVIRLQAQRDNGTAAAQASSTASRNADLEWVREHLPELDEGKQGYAKNALQRLRRTLRREPTPDEVRQLVAQWTRGPKAAA